MRNYKADVLIYSGLFCIAFFVCFTSCLNPFVFRNIDHDTSVFLTIAQGITRGYVPYRDFYDNKGPLTYLISAPGFALGRFSGVWITELIFMYVSVFFAYRIALFFGNRTFAFTAVAFSFVIFQNFFYEVAGTEEYSLPFLMVSLYIFTKYYFLQTKYSPLEIIILGFCFASSMLIRINMFPLWFGFCVMICIETIMKRGFTRLWGYILWFCIGMSIIAIPVLVYLKANNAFADYIHQNFITGISRGMSGFNFKGSFYSFFIITGKNFCFAPLLAGYIWILKEFTDQKRGYYIGYSLAFIMMVMSHAIIRTSFDHYNMVLTPFLIPAFTFFMTIIYKYFSNIKYNMVCFIVFLLILFSTPLVKSLGSLYNAVNDQSRNALVLTGKIIDEQTIEGDKIISLGFPCHIYLFTQRDAASRYIYQASGVAHEPNAHNEFLFDLYTNKPAIIALENKNDRYDYLPKWYAPIYDMIENEYNIITDKNGYFIFKLKEKF